MKHHLIFLSLLFWSLIPVRATTAFSEVFPRIDLDPSHRSATLLWLAEYGREQDWEPLTENTLRLIVQPVGIIEEAYEVNLNTGKVWVYPGTHDRTAKWAFDLTDESLTSLK